MFGASHRRGFLRVDLTIVLEIAFVADEGHVFLAARIVDAVRAGYTDSWNT